MAIRKDEGLEGNDAVEKAVAELKKNFTEEKLAKVLTLLRKRAGEGGRFVVAVEPQENGQLRLRTANYSGRKWFVAYTSFEEELKGRQDVVSGFLADIGKLFDGALHDENTEGVLLNPYGNMITLNKAVLKVILGAQ